MENNFFSGVIIEDEHQLTLDEISRAIHIDKHVVIQMVEYELIVPEGKSQASWRFDSRSLTRAKKAASFYRDLEVNLQGIALILDLLDHIESLEQEMKIHKF